MSELLDSISSFRLTNWERYLGDATSKQKFNFRCYSELSSTMDIAREWVIEGLDTPLLVLADRQNKGRGTQGRVWTMPKRGFTGTFVFSTDTLSLDLSGLSLVCGGVLSETLEREFACKTLVKWPNDLLSVQKEKISGLLVQAFNKGGRRYALIGIGINLEGAPENIPNSVSLKDLTNRSYSSINLAEKIVSPLYQAWNSFQDHGFKGYRQKWLSRACNLNQTITVHSDLGEKVTGVFIGVDDLGHLILSKDGLDIMLSNGRIEERS